MARKHAWMFFLEIICSFRETDAKSDTREKLRVEEQVKSEEKISVPIFEPNVLIVLHVFSHSSLWMSKLSNVKMPILLASKMFSIFFKTLSSSQFGKKTQRANVLGKLKFWKNYKISHGNILGYPHSWLHHVTRLDQSHTIKKVFDDIEYPTVKTKIPF